MAPTKAPAGAEVGLRTPARKANKIDFRTQTTGPGKAKKAARDRAAAGTVCVRLPAKPINSVFVRKPPGREKRERRPGLWQLPTRFACACPQSQ